ncbi:MAG: PQQ-binding-like beta-propeller repeat protein [Pirellulaceae bacterium]|nr:PQQ-binding-like beta-propeller repeat protein [Pirellulaceae bacterium]
MFHHTISRRRFAGLLTAGAAFVHPASRYLRAQAPAAGQPIDAADFPGLAWDKDWPWWRGPQRNGHTHPNCRLPTKFSDTENVRWSAPLPSRGHSSPVIVADAIYLTTADEKAQTHSVLALDRKSGKSLWTRQLSQGGFPENNHSKNTEASPTIACDGQHIIAVFFHHRGIHVTALDLQGKTLWEKRIGDFNPKRYEYGYAPSPVMYRQTVIIVAEHDGDSYLVALRRDTGEEVWRTPRPQSISFSSPSIGQVAGRDQLMISGQQMVMSYDPATGKELWRADGTTYATCGTMVWSGDIALASGGYPKSETIAVRADGSGQVLWKNPQKCYEQSMIVFTHDAVDYLVALTDNGIAFCWRASDGREMWKERLRGPVSASPVLADGKIYWANEGGTMYVLAATPDRFTMLAENRVGEESMASPAVSGNQLFLRVATGSGDGRREKLVCIESAAGR